MSQLDVARAGGPSDTTQSKIELGSAAKVGARTLAKYDRAFQWTQGTAYRILHGSGRPDAAPAPAPSPKALVKTHDDAASVELATVRMSKGWSLAEAAERISEARRAFPGHEDATNLSVGSLSAIEHGSRGISEVMNQAICAAYGLPNQKIETRVARRTAQKATSGELGSRSSAAEGDDVRRLGLEVARRRSELGLSQIELWKRGGPSNSTLTGIESGVSQPPSRTTLRRLDAALEWTPGSAARVLAGGDAAIETPHGSAAAGKQDQGAGLAVELALGADAAAAITLAQNTPDAVVDSVMRLVKLARQAATEISGGPDELAGTIATHREMTRRHWEASTRP